MHLEMDTIIKEEEKLSPTHTEEGYGSDGDSGHAGGKGGNELKRPDLKGSSGISIESDCKDVQDLSVVRSAPRCSAIRQVYPGIECKRISRVTSALSAERTFPVSGRT